MSQQLFFPSSSHPKCLQTCFRKPAHFYSQILAWTYPTISTFEKSTSKLPTRIPVLHSWKGTVNLKAKICGTLWRCNLNLIKSKTSTFLKLDTNICAKLSVHLDAMRVHGRAWGPAHSWYSQALFSHNPQSPSRKSFSLIAFAQTSSWILPLPVDTSCSFQVTMTLNICKLV